MREGGRGMFSALAALFGLLVPPARALVVTNFTGVYGSYASYNGTGGSVILSPKAHSSIYVRSLVDSFFIPEVVRRADMEGGNIQDMAGVASAQVAITLLEDVTSAGTWTDTVSNALCGRGNNEALEAWRKSVSESLSHPEGYVLTNCENSNYNETIVQEQPAFFHITANSEKGVLFGLGRILRDADISANGTLYMPREKCYCVANAPKPWNRVRGHQLTRWGFDFNPWPSAMKQYVHDLAIFGTNQIELAHIELPADVPRIADYSKLSESLQLNLSLWFPLDLYMGSSEAPAQTKHLLRTIPRLNSIFVPGGDGGIVLAPKPFLEACEGLAKVVRGFHPEAEIWVSAQEFDSKNMTDFYRLVGSNEVQSWLTGVAYGPHVRVPLTEFLRSLPNGTLVRQYPDLCHTVHSQFEVPAWDPAFAWTHGRDPVNPAPKQFHHILTLRENSTYVSSQHKGGRLVGFGGYSEGAGDDLNKMVWCAGAADDLGAESIVVQYSRHFFGSQAASLMKEALFGLENNWRAGDLSSAHAISVLSKTLRDLEAAWAAALIGGKQRQKNWRLQMYIHRGNYDLHVSLRARFERRVVQKARDILIKHSTSGGNSSSATQALQEASSLLWLPTPRGVKRSISLLERRLSELTMLLNTSVGLSVIQSQSPGLAMSSLYANFSDLYYLRDRVGKALQLPIGRRENAVRKLAEETRILEKGGYLDLLGSPILSEKMHLDMGEGSTSDPSFYFTPLQATTLRPLQTDLPIAWQRFAHPFYDYIMRLKYTGLSRGRAYNLTVVRCTIPEENNQIRVSLRANGELVHDLDVAPYPMAPLSYTIDSATIGENGVLELAWQRETGLGGNGQGGFISSVKLQEIFQ